LCKLEESWRGPVRAVERLGEVNYRVESVEGKKKQGVVHVNVLKAYVKKEDYIKRLVIWTEEEDEQGI